jgi:biotin synthase
MIEKVFSKSIEGQELTDSDIDIILNTPLEELLDYSYKIKKHYFGNDIDTCGIINAKSGLCSEDCAFCAQSAHHDTSTPVYSYIDVEEVRKHAEKMAKEGVRRYAAVISGKTPNAEEFERLKESMRIITELGMIADMSVGMLTKEQLYELKECGLQGYHHNLETARSYYPQICSTHEYDENVESVKAALEVGLYVCCGGIFGIGETWSHRVELARELKSLGIPSVPLNFLNPIAGTPLGGSKPLTQDEALRIIALFRFIHPKAHIRICGGRTLVFPAKDKEKLFTSGVSGLMVGDYLVVKGEGLQSDMEAVNRHINAD